MPTPDPEMALPGPEMALPDPELGPAEALRAEQEAELEAERAGSDVAGLDALEGEVGAEAAEDIQGDPVGEPDSGGAEPELSIALSPRQILGGFALLAAIVVWLLRRRKG